MKKNSLKNNPIKYPRSFWLKTLLASIFTGLVLSLILSYLSRGYYTNYNFMGDSDSHELLYSLWLSISVGIFLTFTNLLFFQNNPNLFLVLKIAGIVLAISLGALTASVAWQHNPQFEFHYDGVDPNWSRLANIFFSGFDLVVLVQFIILGILKVFWRK